MFNCIDLSKLTRNLYRIGLFCMIHTFSINSLQANTYNVTTLSDIINSSDGVTSLREAINDANSNPGKDDILISAGLIGNLLINSQLAITDDLEIFGSNKTVDANQNCRIFNIDDGNTVNFIEVVIHDLRITGGNENGYFVSGGGIYNSENLQLNNCIINHNKLGVTSDGGAGIYHREGVLEIYNCTI